MLQQVSGHNVGLVVGYTPNRLDVRTRQEQRVGTRSQDDMVNTGINMLREAIVVIVSRRLEESLHTNFTVCRFGKSEKHRPSSTRTDFMEKPATSKLAILHVNWNLPQNSFRVKTY